MSEDDLIEMVVNIIKSSTDNPLRIKQAADAIVSLVRDYYESQS